MLNPKNGPEKELSEESCELEAAAVLPASCLRHLDSSNWKERISCLEAFEKAVEVMEKNQMPCQALVRLLDKEPGWRETKLQVMQKKLHIVTLIAQRGNFSKTSAQFVLGNLVDKVGDVICGSDTKEALTAVAEACGLPWTARKVTEAAFSQDSPRTHSETLNWLSSVIKDFGFDGMEAKALVGYIKSALTAAHPDVRASAFNLLGVIYLYIGAPLRTFFEDEKPPLLSQIDAEFEKMNGQSPPSPSRGRCKFCRDDANEQRGGDAQSRRRNDTADISRKISAELMLKMQDTSWKIRKEGLEEIVRILTDATSIKPTIGDLPVALKACLYDSNKAVVKQTLIVLQQLARVMGPGIKHHVKALGLPMIAVLRESKSNLRALAFTTLEAWAEQTSMKEWLEGEELFKEHLFQRQGILGWLAEKLPSTSSVSADLFRCVPHLYSSMEDHHEEMRLVAHEALPFFLLHLGFEKMSEAADKLKPSSRDQLLPILEKAKAGRPAKPTISFAKTFSKLPRGKSWSNSSSTPTKQSSLASIPTESPESSELNLEVKKAKSEGAVQNTKKPPSIKLPSKLNTKEDSSQKGPIFIVVPKAKEQRVKDEKALKVLRWNFSTPSSKYVEQLKGQMCGCLSSWLQEELFHSNFQHHIRALTVMTKHLESEKNGVISCLDLILKWLTLRLFDTNTWVLMKTLEYLKRLFSLLIEEKYQLTESEASSFFPYLLLKMGGTKESILKEVRAIVKQITLVYPVSRIFYFLLEGAQAKNPNQRVGCLKELGWLLKAYGPDVCQPNPSKALKTIITLTGDSNNAVHSAALKAIATARDVYGVEAFKTIGNISEKHMSLLEESMKEVAARQGNLGIKACSGEGSKRSSRTSNYTEEDYFVPQLEQVEVKDAYPLAVAKVPQPTDIVPHGTNLDSPAESSITSNINMIICRVASGNISTSIEALVQIKEILRQEDIGKAMSGHINQFLIATLRQLKFIHRLHVTAEERKGKEQVTELYSCVICNMVSLFQMGSLAQEACAGVLKDLMNTLISLLLDSPVDELQKSQEATQSVNLLINKILEKSDPTRILKTLLILLHEGLTANTNLLGFSELVAKCLWKATRLLPQTIHSIHLDQLLLETHIFMKALPKERLKQYESSYPHRALKTLLHTLCKLKGAEILDHLTLIENRDESELEAHLWKVVRHLAEQSGMDGDKETSCPPESEVNCALAALFKKINNKETARAGLEELYEYKKKHPDADIEPFLKNCSLLFRSYVKHGLAVIGSERESKQKNCFLTGKPA
ncbi:cytoskeleton-associated protein 5-like [Hemicordylus capensis]|uniref:cytoskeleton-associated protein 5-like n=1 Tax=Hemicordylus capensis TaxID=884348 RepID=UPI002302E073|nr:cytoskeleton-associated protein 5-like [Hemicordylus capensis]